MKTDIDWFATLLGWFPMLLLIGVWVYFMQKLKGGVGHGGYQAKIVEEYVRHNELLAKIIERMDDRITRLESAKSRSEFDKK